MLNHYELRNKDRQARRLEEQRDHTTLITLCLLVVLFVACVAFIAYADDIKDEQAIMAIIGEAENQNYEGMLAVAGAIRNRGTLHGVYGLKAPRVIKKLYSRRTLMKATLAWQESARRDITDGATNWENVNAFGKPYWANSMVMTTRIGDHVFYKNK